MCVYIFAYTYIYIYIYIYIYMYISWQVAVTDFPDPLSLLVSIVHRCRQVFYATFSISTELLQIGSRWSP